MCFFKGFALLRDQFNRAHQRALQRGVGVGLDQIEEPDSIDSLPFLQSLPSGRLLQQSVQRTFEKSRSTERSIAPLSPSYRPVGMAGGRASVSKSLRSSAGLRKASEPTLACPNGMSHKVVKWRGKDFCTVDKKVLEQSMGLEV